MAKDRHKGRKVQAYLNDDELRRFDRVRPTQGTDKETVLKLLEIAETKNEEEQKLRHTIKEQKIQIDKLIKDAKNRVDEDKEVRDLRNRLEAAELQTNKYELESSKPKAVKEEPKQLSKTEPLPVAEKTINRKIEETETQKIYPQERDEVQRTFICPQGKGSVEIKTCRSKGFCPLGSDLWLCPAFIHAVVNTENANPSD